MNLTETHLTLTATATPTLSTQDFHDQLIAILPSLRQQALALTRNAHDADDLVQTAVGNALAAKNTFMPGTGFRAWMGMILRNRFLSDYRRRRPTTSIDDAPDMALARSGGQHESLEVQELQRHLARLPADHRLLLIMISVQGLSYEEASQQLGIAVGTLKARVSRTRAQLRAWLMGEAEDAPKVAAAPRRRAVRPRHAVANPKLTIQGPP